MKFLRAAVPVALVALLVTFFVPSPDAGRVIAASEASTAKTETAVLAGGCFWGMESVFEHVRGVTNVVSGFSGGSKETAHYDDVSEGDTGHAESVEITYDPARISYATLLDVYFRVAHDPTELNAQGPDSGTQYRSAIFYASPDQKRIAEAKIAALTAQHVFPGADRHAGRPATRFLSGGVLPPALRRPAPALSVHRHQRRAETRAAPRALPEARGLGRSALAPGFAGELLLDRFGARRVAAGAANVENVAAARRRAVLGARRIARRDLAETREILAADRRFINHEASVPVRPGAQTMNAPGRREAS